MNLDDVQNLVGQALEPGYRGRLLARGQARAMIWRDGQLPPGAPAFIPSLSYDLLGYGYALRLTRGIEIWAKGMGATYVLYHATSGTNPTSSDRFFRKLGMTTLGGNYGVRLSGEDEAGP